MKALTIQQPYAALIAAGSKVIENRSWPTKHRGPLAIHAGQGTNYLDACNLRDYTFGVVAIVELYGCLMHREIIEAYQNKTGIESGDLTLTAAEVATLATHEHIEGPFCWLLRNVQPLPVPISIGGRLGLWELRDDLIPQLEGV